MFDTKAEKYGSFAVLALSALGAAYIGYAVFGGADYFGVLEDVDDSTALQIGGGLLVVSLLSLGYCWGTDTNFVRKGWTRDF